LKALGLQTIALADIDFGDRLRAVDEAHARLLAENIRETGRIRQPIEIRKVRARQGGKPFVLIAGGHRLYAAGLLSWTQIDAFVFEASDDEARLAEIDENLVRHDLNPLDRGVFLAQREEVYLRLHPETGQGGDCGNQHTGGKARQDDIVSFCQDTAQRCGWTARTIQRALQVGSLPPEVRARLAGTYLARNQAELLALVKVEPALQLAVINMLLAENSPAKSVAAAARILSGTRAPEIPASEAAFQKLLAVWRRADSGARRAFLAHLRETGQLAMPEKDAA